MVQRHYQNTPNDHKYPPPVQDDLTHAQLESQLQNAFEREPVEDGILHAAENIIRDALRSPVRQEMLEHLRSLALNAKDPVVAASTLRCLGREREAGSASWRTELVRAALKADDLLMRDAAIQAAETWGDKEIVEILQGHTETDEWLRSYLENVIADLGE